VSSDKNVVENVGETFRPPALRDVRRQELVRHENDDDVVVVGDVGLEGEGEEGRSGREDKGRGRTAWHIGSPACRIVSVFLSLFSRTN